MIISDEKLQEILVGPGYLSDVEFMALRDEAKRSRKDLEDVLIDKNFLKDSDLGKLIAVNLNFEFVNLREENIDEDVLNVIPENVARERQLIAFGIDRNGFVMIGMINPEDIATRQMVEKRIGHESRVFLITKNDFISALSRYKSSIKSIFLHLLEKVSSRHMDVVEKDSTIIEMVDSIILYGYQNKASDIHLEPYTESVLVRFRIDGIMHDILSIPKDIFQLMLSRIKIMSKMRTDEHMAAMDGKLKIKADDELVDVRVSVIPVTEGENVVMRILSAKSRQFGLLDLGMSDGDLSKVRRAIKNPHGLIIVTGPTGSGKTTTVYSIMKILNTRDVHISSIEDPVEYEIEGISQIQVNQKTSLTFANGLKAIVRQDPDIIMVGEIRDEETANISVNAAMTGHLVLTTLHANDAATSIPRLMDMKVEPFLIASTVNIMMAQRLVRRICPKCISSYKLSEDEAVFVESNPTLMASLKKKNKDDLRNIYFYKGLGCGACHNSGFLGRIGIFEVVEINEIIKESIAKKATSDEIADMARKTGAISILDDGINKVFTGITTIEEIIRVTKE